MAFVPSGLLSISPNVAGFGVFATPVGTRSLEPFQAAQPKCFKSSGVRGGSQSVMYSQVACGESAKGVSPWCRHPKMQRERRSCGHPHEPQGRKPRAGGRGAATDTHPSPLKHQKSLLPAPEDPPGTFFYPLQSSAHIQVPNQCPPAP